MDDADEGRWFKGFTLPGHKYCGPFNPMRLGVPANKLDELCLEHDMAYGRLSASGINPYTTWTEADEEFVRKIHENSFGTWSYASLVYFIFHVKKLMAYKRKQPDYTREPEPVRDPRMFQTGPPLPSNAPSLSARQKGSLRKMVNGVKSGWKRSAGRYKRGRRSSKKAKAKSRGLSKSQKRGVRAIMRQGPDIPRQLSMETVGAQSVSSSLRQVAYQHVSFLNTAIMDSLCQEISTQITNPTGNAVTQGLADMTGMWGFQLNGKGMVDLVMRNVTEDILYLNFYAYQCIESTGNTPLSFFQNELDELTHDNSATTETDTDVSEWVYPDQYHQKREFKKHWKPIAKQPMVLQAGQEIRTRVSFSFTYRPEQQDVDNYAFHKGSVCALFRLMGGTQHQSDNNANSALGASIFVYRYCRRIWHKPKFSIRQPFAKFEIGTNASTLTDPAAITYNVEEEKMDGA